MSHGTLALHWEWMVFYYPQNGKRLQRFSFSSMWSAGGATHILVEMLYCWQILNDSPGAKICTWPRWCKSLSVAACTNVSRQNLNFENGLLTINAPGQKILFVSWLNVRWSLWDCQCATQQGMSQLCIKCSLPYGTGSPCKIISRKQIHK